jgi:hypothetical protein
VKGPPPRVTAPDAIALIRKLTKAGVQILGVDGFVVVPEGFMADLDLMLDVSERPMTAEEAAAETKAFIDKHARSDVVWEVWADDDE